MTQRLPPSLTPLDTALAALLRDVEPIAPVALPLTEAIGCIAADAPLLAAYPPHDIAGTDRKGSARSRHLHIVFVLGDLIMFPH